MIASKHNPSGVNEAVSTYGNSAVDVFYVKDVFGMKIESEKRINLIKKNIELALMDDLETEKIQ